ncbi:aconitase/3-isopropylmalate dehydratase large subunit family protein [Chloroflexota bacterium]
MGMTITEKILACAAGKETVSPGEIVNCKVDVVCVDEAQFPIYYPAFQEMGRKIYDPQKAIFTVDHYVPSVTVRQAETNKAVKEFARHQGIKAYIAKGIKHQIFRTYGIARPGIVMVGTDSHMNTSGAFGAFAAALGPTEAAIVCKTGEIWFKVPETIRFDLNGTLNPLVTAKDITLSILGKHGTRFGQYRAIEFSGTTIEAMSIDARMTLCCMSTEMGAKNGIIAPDDKVMEYLSERVDKSYRVLRSDPDARYLERYEIDASAIEPLVAVPHNPGNVKLISEVRGIEIDQAFIGSCAGGNLEDLEAAAKVLEGRHVHPDVRMIITPASREIYAQAEEKGLIKAFINAGAMVSSSTCSVCVGLEGVLAAGEVCISTSTRNFKGRMGSSKANVYLASSLTVAASAIRGQIADVRRIV